MKTRFKTVVFCLALYAGAFSLKAQSIISGQVLSLEGKPAPFTVLAIDGSHRSVTADENGNFKFDGVNNGTHVILTRSFGFLEKADTIKVEGNTTFNPVLKPSPKILEEVVVDATRVNNNQGMAFSNVDEETIKKQNLGQDAPYILNSLPNVVVNSDAGNAVGYTGIRIRGSDGTRINVTINGVPVNDAESQGTFWVNMPDLVSSVNNIQVQRGVGASSNGAGAFGATINFQTNVLQDKPYANLISTAGSFDTYRNTLAAGTGLLNNKFTLDARASKITSRGYIDRATSDLSSYYLAAGFYGKNTIVKFINFSGWEKTYQAWYYVNSDSVKKGNRTYNSAGAYTDANGNTRYYRNETDNYNQNNSQLHFIKQINSRVNFNLTGHYTKGKGYYEQYKEDQFLEDYQIQPLITAKGDTIANSDLIRRLGLDNDFAGAIFNLNIVASTRLKFTLGGGYNSYFGKHIGTVVWSKIASDSETGHRYYLNSANKNDMNVYLKTNYKVLSNINVFLDLQSRSVNYRFQGFDNSLQSRMQNVSYQFFNPKLGVSIDVSEHLNIYFSVARANKEPNRDDFVQSSPQSRPRPEQLTDQEAGIKFISKKFFMGVNFYNMIYKDQLVLNGQVNNVGAYNRVNVAESFRRGVELEFDYRFNRFVSAGGNLSLSQNKIASFTEYVDSSDVNYTVFTQYKKEYKNTDISFSPSMVSAFNLTFRPVKNLELVLLYKMVNRQYLDNTSNVGRSIDPYSVLDARFNYLLKTKLIPEINFMFCVYNVLNEQYETNGYTYSYYTDTALNTFNFLAPAAPINFLGGISLKF